MPIPEDELEAMRQRDFAAAEAAVDLPARFTAEREPGLNHVVITDTQTGRLTVCWLFNYKMIRNLLNDLFGED